MCVSLINEEINLMDQVEHEKLTQIHNKKTIMKRAGSSIEEYHQLQLQQPDKEIPGDGNWSSVLTTCLTTHALYPLW
ncbi:hypothetical protein ACSBR2_016070 [Camellia fascicularis]